MLVHSTERELVETAIAWLQEGYRVALVTVVQTWGSSPRPVGSLMLLRGDGQHAGSVSGGCVETDLVSRFRDQQLAGPFPTRIDYGIDREEAARFGLPCGGRLELVVEQLAGPGPMAVLLEKLRANELIVRRLCLETGEVSLHPATGGEDFVCEPTHLQRVFGPGWTMLLIGAGHLSQYVAQLALMLDYRVFVCDPREDYQKGWSVAGTELVNGMPDEAVHSHAGHPRSVVLALTHDPRLDDMALLDALASAAFYVGALGSRRSSEQRRARLAGLGVTPQQLQALHAPVGLAIGSHTPPEIALSILAEITALRNAAPVESRQAITAA